MSNSDFKINIHAARKPPVIEESGVRTTIQKSGLRLATPLAIGLPTEKGEGWCMQVGSAGGCLSHDPAQVLLGPDLGP